ncbi:RICIN domain-containing protein [Streptomyces sp. NBC_00878]|nr:RICIN domain-containing protein [Streptomyces sp. NBC_00878]
METGSGPVVSVAPWAGDGAGHRTGIGQRPGAGSGSAPGTGYQPGAGSGSGPGTGHQPGAGSGSGPGSGYQPGTGVGHRPGTGTGSGSGFGYQPGAGFGPGPGTGLQSGTGSWSGPGSGRPPGTGRPLDAELDSDADSVWGPSPRQGVAPSGTGSRPGSDARSDTGTHPAGSARPGAGAGAGAGAGVGVGPSTDPDPVTGSHLATGSPVGTGHDQGVGSQTGTAHDPAVGSHRAVGRVPAAASFTDAGPRHAVRLPPHPDTRPGEPGRRSPRRRNLALAVLVVSGCVLVPLALWSGGGDAGQTSASDTGAASAEPDAGPTRIGTGGADTGTVGGRLRNVGSGDCLGIADGRAAAGAEVVLATCSSSERQQWSYESDGLLRSLADKDLCLDSRLASSVRLGPCDGEKGRVSVHYDLTLEGNLVPLGRPNLALAPVSGEEETGLVLKTRNEGKAQRWEIDTSVDSLQMEWITSYTNSDTAKPQPVPSPDPTPTSASPTPSQAPPTPRPTTPAPAPSWCFGYYCGSGGYGGGGYDGGHDGYGGGGWDGHDGDGDGGGGGGHGDGGR